MSDFAIITLGGAQHLVRPGQVLRVARIALSGKTHTFKDVLAGRTVHANVLDIPVKRKVDVRKYKSKVRYLRRKGYKETLTTFKITKIEK